MRPRHERQSRSCSFLRLDVVLCGSDMRSAGLLILLFGDPCADDLRQAPLDEPPAGRSRLIVYGLADKLAGEGIAIAHRRFR